MRRVELSAAGVHPQTLARLVQEGTLARVTRGLYQLGEADITAPHELAEVAKLAPKGAVCLVSALQFHELTLQMPSRVWLAIGTKARSPKIDYPQSESCGSESGRYRSAWKSTPSTACRSPSSTRPRQWSIAFDSEGTSVSMWRSRAFTASRDREDGAPDRRGDLGPQTGRRGLVPRLPATRHGAPAHQARPLPEGRRLSEVRRAMVERAAPLPGGLRNIANLAGHSQSTEPAILTMAASVPRESHRPSAGARPERVAALAQRLARMDGFARHDAVSTSARSRPTVSRVPVASA